MQSKLQNGLLVAILDLSFIPKKENTQIKIIYTHAKF